MDLNHRPPGPEPGALARLSHAPTACNNLEEQRTTSDLSDQDALAGRPDKTLSLGWLERELQLNIAAEGAATLASLADPVRRPIRFGDRFASVAHPRLWRIRIFGRASRKQQSRDIWCIREGIRYLGY